MIINKAERISHLINAAPDLLAALKSFIECRALKQSMAGISGNARVWSESEYHEYDKLSQQLARIEPQTWLDAARAIAKAEGRS